MPASSPSSPPDSGFIPRKEFIRVQASPSSFALLALSSSNCIRLYSFSHLAIAAIRSLLEKRGTIIAFREDLVQNLCEFSLDGKPWANPKAPYSENLIVDILSAIYTSRYTYLSTIDYGREPDDRLVMVFSTPAPVQPSGSRSGSPSIPSRSPQLVPNGSGSFQEKLWNKRVPFALSFVSATVMRVIAPPLHLTPAILQAVRGSWPRGVVSEKKVGDNCFEFKLNGYKWFQQDDFATDSLRHILSLLSSLDLHSFSLLTSMSLTNRSRVKDLWIFTGPAPSAEERTSQDSPAHSILDSSTPELTTAAAKVHQNSANPQIPPPLPHRRLATEPANETTHFTTQHARAATDNNATYRHVQANTALHIPNSSGSSSNVLRKPAPRAQVPVSVAHEDIPGHIPGHDGFRIQLPSVISSDVENMTGVGAGRTPDVLYSSSPYEAVNNPKHSSDHTPAISLKPKTISPDRNQQPLSERAKTPPLLVSHSASPSLSSQHTVHAPPFNQQKAVVVKDMDHASLNGSAVSPLLLGAGTFRDSGTSSHSDMSTDIPIKWTGNNIGVVFEEENIAVTSERPQNNRESSVPMFPGGWHPTPVEEMVEENVTHAQEEEKKDTAQTPVHEVGSRINSPEFIQPDARLRKSEAALVGMIASTSSPEPLEPMPQRPQHQRKESQLPGGAGNAGGHGWVLVNVETPINTSQGDGTTPGALSDSPHIMSGSQRNSQIPRTKEMEKGENIAISSPTAKAIVVLDAMETKSNKPRTSSKKESADESQDTPRSIKRFFSSSRKNSRRVGTSDELKQQTQTKRSVFRERLRVLGTREASRREDKRRSIDWRWTSWTKYVCM